MASKSDTNRQESKNGDLSPRQLKAIPHLIAAPNYSEGCRQAKIGRTTFEEWKGSEAFRKALRDAERHIYRDSLVEIERGTTEAIQAIRGLIQASENEAIRLRAASELLSFSLKAREAIDVEDRLSELERQLREGGYYEG